MWEGRVGTKKEGKGKKWDIKGKIGRNNLCEDSGLRI